MLTNRVISESFAYFLLFHCRATTEQCPFAIIVMSLQSIMGVIIQACMAGIIFAKFTVPRARGETIIYSKNAVITLRNGALYLLCRVSDLRKSSLLEAHVRMLFVKKEVTGDSQEAKRGHLAGAGQVRGMLGRFRTSMRY